MKAAVHTVGGLKCTRKSPRVYTHAVVGQYDAARAIARCLIEEPKLAKVNFAHYCRVATGVDVYASISAEQLLQYKTTVELGEEAYIAKCIKCCVDRYERDAAQGIQVLRWSQSLRNAQNACSSYTPWYCKVRVVDVARAA